MKDRNLREIFVHSSLRSHANSTPGTFPYSTDRCKACPTCALTPPLEVSMITCTSRGLSGVRATTWYMPSPVNLATSSKLVSLTSRSLVFHFSEHLADIHHKRSNPVAQHVNSAGHTIADVKVEGLRQLYGDTFQRKHTESHIIHRLGTMSPRGLNEKCSNFL